MYTIRPIHLAKYVFWFIVLSMFTTYFLIYSGQLEIPHNDSTLYYIIVHDALKPVLGVIIVVFTGYVINYVTSETLTHRFAINRILFSFNNRIQLWIADLIIILMLSCYIVINRLLDVEVIPSKEKLEFIVILIVLVLFIKFLGWLSWTLIRSQLLRLADLLLVVITLPFVLFSHFSNEVNESDLPVTAKKIFLFLLRVICLAMLLTILYYIVQVFKMTAEDYVIR